MSELATLPQLARRLGVAASTARGPRRYPDFRAPAQTAVDRHLDAVADVDAWHGHHNPLPEKRTTHAT